jgi:hypothetical protein
MENDRKSTFGHNASGGVIIGLGYNSSAIGVEGPGSGSTTIILKPHQIIKNKAHSSN